MGTGKRAGFRIAGAIVAFMLAIGVNARLAQAVPLTFTTTGNVGGQDVSASAEFTYLGGGDVQLVLTNTTTPQPPGTTANAAALTDFFFTILSGDPIITMTSAMGDTILLDDNGTPGDTSDDSIISASNVNLLASVTNGAWEFVGHPGSTFGLNENNVDFPYEYGLSTAGDGGLFNGDLVDGPDYHIVAATTDLHADGLKNAIAVDTSATFILHGFTNTETIGNVAWSWGTVPDLVSDGGGPPQTFIPEPATMVLLGIGLCGLLVGRKRKA